MDVGLNDTTAEQRFMFMLLDRIDTLSDSVHNIEQNLKLIKKNIPLIVEEHQHIFDKACFLNNDTNVNSKRTYCRFYLKTNEDCEKLKKYLIKLDYVSYIMSYILPSCDVSEMFEPHEETFYILQCIIEFKWKKYVSHLLYDVYSEYEHSFFNADKCCFFNDISNDFIAVYYELTITAGSLNIPITQAKNETVLHTEGCTNIRKLYSVLLSHLTPNEVMSRYFIVHNENSGIGHAYTTAFIIALLPAHLSC